MIFLLLLFFLLGSDFVTYGQNRLAPPRGAGGNDSAVEPAIVTLAANGALQWNGAPIERPALRQRASEAARASDNQVFVLMPNGAANVQQVTHIMDVLIGAGAKSVTLERDIFDIDLADF
jgi:biopolymer transport protein ExbD